MQNLLTAVVELGGKAGGTREGQGVTCQTTRPAHPSRAFGRELSTSRPRALPASLSCARGPRSTSVQRAMLPKLDFPNVLNFRQCQEYCK